MEAPIHELIPELKSVLNHLDSITSGRPWEHITFKAKSSALLKDLVNRINQLIDLHHDTSVDVFSYMYLPQKSIKAYGILQRMLDFMKKLHHCKLTFCILRNIDEPFRGFNIKIDSQKAARKGADYFSDEGYHIIRLLEKERRTLDTAELKARGNGPLDERERKIFFKALKQLGDIEVYIPVLISSDPSRVYGVICLSERGGDRKSYKDSEKEFLQTYAGVCAEFHFENKFRSQATFDVLTNLHSARQFENQMASALDQSLRTRHPFSIVYLDLDNFRRINTKYGHLAGDHVISTVGQKLKQAIRGEDIAFRQPAIRKGGDEFCIVLPNTPGEGAEGLRARLNSALNTISVKAGRDKIGIRATIVHRTFDPVNDKRCPPGTPLTIEKKKKIAMDLFHEGERIATSIKQKRRKKRTIKKRTKERAVEEGEMAGQL